MKQPVRIDPEAEEESRTPTTATTENAKVWTHGEPHATLANVSGGARRTGG